MGRTFLASGGTKLPGSQVYGRNVDPRLLRAYLPKEKRWHEPRDKKVDDDEVDTKKAQAAPSVKDEPAKSDDGVSDDDGPGVKLEQVKLFSEQYRSLGREQRNNVLISAIKTKRAQSATKRKENRARTQTVLKASKELFPSGAPGSPLVKSTRRRVTPEAIAEEMSTATDP
jgi:hypothetical protein